MIQFTDKTKVFHAGIYCFWLLILVNYKMSHSLCWYLTDYNFDKTTS